MNHFSNQIFLFIKKQVTIYHYNKNTMQLMQFPIFCPVVSSIDSFIIYHLFSENAKQKKFKFCFFLNRYSERIVIFAKWKLNPSHFFVFLFFNFLR